MIQLNEASKAKSVLMIKVKNTNILRELADKLDQVYHNRKSEQHDITVELVPGVSLVMDCTKEGFKPAGLSDTGPGLVGPLHESKVSER